MYDMYRTVDVCGCVFRIVDMTVKKGVVEVRNPKGMPNEPPKTFTFDAVYDWK